MPFLSSCLSCGQETRLVGAAPSLPLPAELRWQQQRAGVSSLLRVRVVCGATASAHLHSLQAPLDKTTGLLACLWPLVGCAVSCMVSSLAAFFSLPLAEWME